MPAVFARSEFIGFFVQWTCFRAHTLQIAVLSSQLLTLSIYRACSNYEKLFEFFNCPNLKKCPANWVTIGWDNGISPEASSHYLNQWYHKNIFSPLICEYSNAFIHSTAWWRHKMEAFHALLAICAGNSPVPGDQRPVTRRFDVFFDLRLNKRLSKQSWGWWFETPSRPVWHHCSGTWSYHIYCYRHFE